MTLRQQQVLSVVVGALVAVLNSTLGWHLNANTVIAIVAAFAVLAYTIGQVEAAHGTLAQDWAAIKPELVSLLDALDGAAHSQATPIVVTPAPQTPPKA